METGQLINRIDNNVLESSDSTLQEEPEVNIVNWNFIFFFHVLIKKSVEEEKKVYKNFQ